jgi:putative oxidoreductase
MRKGDWQGYARSILRIVAALLFICHGCQKLFGMFGGARGGMAHAWSQAWVAGILETFGGALILMGLFTRPVAFLLCGEMAVAYFQVHYPRNFWPIRNMGETPVLFCFIFLYLVTAGPGPLSLDRSLRKRE